MTELSEVLDGERKWCVVHGEASSVLWVMQDCCVDAVVCDPPAGVAFMNAKWDQDKGGRRQWIRWLRGIARELLRVLKPGGHALVWALPRTSHWTGMALEEAGFEARDCIVHIFGSGFPKSLSASKAIDAKLGTTSLRQVVHRYTAGGNAGTSTADKGGTYGVGAPNSDPIELTVTSGGSPEAREWDGYGTSLKPAAELWWLVRKPLEGTLADNVLQHGCGALNIDACRIPTDWSERSDSWKRSGHSAKPDEDKIAAPPGVGIQCHPAGRWPANTIFSHDPECTDRCIDGCAVKALGEQSGNRVNGGNNESAWLAEQGRQFGCYGPKTGSKPTDFAGDSGTASRYFYCAKPSRAERELGLEGFPKLSPGQATKRQEGTAGISPRAGAGRSGGTRNPHPTVKSIDLMRYLVRLVARPGAVVLDPFCGSGTTGMAAVLEGCRFVGIELNDTADEPFVRIARARIAHCADWKPPPVQEGQEPPRQRSLFG
jgi:hypothetical protein